jgi:fructuronate reductase
LSGTRKGFGIQEEGNNMLLNKATIKSNRADWEAMGIELPRFNIDEMTANTREKPQWVHFGAGNIFRGFIANAYQKLLDNKKVNTGIVAVESYDYEIIDRIYKPYDNLTLLVLMNPDGNFRKTIIGSIAEGITADRDRPQDYKRLIKIFENPSLKIASFTITEKGYSLNDASGNYLQIVQRDIENGPGNPLHTISLVTALAYARYKKGQYPITLISMDNCSNNGDRLKESVMTIAEEWLKRGFVDEGFVVYLTDENKITYPLSMIDKITPRPSEIIGKALKDQGLEDMDIVVTSRNTYIAPFVNAEISEYLVIEDRFANGRPPLEDAGIILTDRETVNKVETMKVTTCLNPLHTALAIFGCLLGYNLIADEMKDRVLRKLVERVGYDEGLKVVVDPEIINPKEFIDEVINVRFSNPYIPDTPQRIATDTSQKVGIRFGETIKSYAKRGDLNPADLVGIPLAIAGWFRYLLGIDDEGEKFEVSSDPLMSTLQGILEGVSFGASDSRVSDIISNKSIFGVDLYEVGIGEKIESIFYEMLEGKGAVRRTLGKYLNV